MSGLDVKTSDSALALRRLALCLELAVALTYHPVVFRAEALLKPAPAHDSHYTDHQGCDYDDGTTMATMIPVDMKITCFHMRSRRVDWLGACPVSREGSAILLRAW